MHCIPLYLFFDFYLYMFCANTYLLGNVTVFILSIHQKVNQNLYYTRDITPKRVTGPISAVASRWRRCVRVDRPGNRTPDLPLRWRSA